MTTYCRSARARRFSRDAASMAFVIAAFFCSSSLLAQAVPTSVCVDKHGCGGSEPAATPSRAVTRDNSAEIEAARLAAVRAADVAAANEKGAAEQAAAEEKRIADKAEAGAQFKSGLRNVKLKGVMGASANGKATVLKSGTALTLKPGSRPPNAAAERQKLAWKQLHCATAFARKALEILQTQTDISDFHALQTDALSALDGRATKVGCDAAPEMPAMGSGGAVVDMEAGKTAERMVLERAGQIADRMEAQPSNRAAVSTADPKQVQSAVPETAIEKVRRVQRELNVINSVKTGKTQAEINESESIRLKLSNLVLVNNKLAKGETVDMTVNLLDDPAPPKRIPLKPEKK